jgi:hypothetical protein
MGMSRNEAQLGALPQFLYDFDAPNVTYKFGQQGCLVTQPGADLENDVFGFWGKKVCHESAHERL